jgi:hypothetical protein
VLNHRQRRAAARIGIDEDEKKRTNEARARAGPCTVKLAQPTRKVLGLKFGQSLAEVEAIVGPLRGYGTAWTFTCTIEGISVEL